LYWIFHSALTLILFLKLLENTVRETDSQSTHVCYECHVTHGKIIAHPKVKTVCRIQYFEEHWEPKKKHFSEYVLLCSTEERKWGLE